MSVVTEEGNALIKEADSLVKQAYVAQQVVDSHHLFLCASDLYQEAGAQDSARWAERLAEQCQRILARQVWD